jgi:hypothetical protein
MSGDSGDVAAIVSEVRHDATNALMAIFGYLELLRDREDLPEGVAPKLKLIEAEAYRIRDQIARMSFIRTPNA